MTDACTSVANGFGQFFCHEAAERGVADEARVSIVVLRHLHGPGRHHQRLVHVVEHGRHREAAAVHDVQPDLQHWE